MGQLSSHQALVEQTFPINKGTITPGMILEFTYSKVDRKGKQTSKKYMILALSEVVRGPGANKIIHGITLDVVSKIGLTALAKRTGLEFANSRLEARKLKIEKVITADPRAYYASIIKGQLGGSLKGSYRTFIDDRLTALKICEYKWPVDMLLEDSNKQAITPMEPVDPTTPKLGDK